MRRAASTEHLASRPTLPPLLLAGIALWLGCLAASEVLPIIGAFGLLAVGIGCVLGLVGAGVGVRMRHGVLPAIFGVFFCLGLVLSFGSLTALESQRSELIGQSGQTFQLRMLDDASEGQFGSYCTAVAYTQDSDWFQRTFGGIKVRVNLDDDTWEYGDELQARLTFKAPSEAAKASYDAKRIVFSCKMYKAQRLERSRLGALAESRSAFSSKIADLAQGLELGDSVTALAQALLLGNRSSLFGQCLYQEVKSVGLAHMVAVSGAHLVIVMGFASLVLKALHIGKRIQIAVQLVFLFLYLCMVGFPVSCMRAAIMSGVGMLSIASLRRSHSLSALGLTCLVVISLDSSAASSVSFALSALSTLGIVLFMPLFCGWFKTRSDTLNRYVLEPVAMTLAALLLTLPVSLSLFAQLPLISPVSNVVASPLVTVICSAGVAAFALQQIPLLGGVLLSVALVGSSVLCAAVSTLSQIPFACIPLGAEPVLAALGCVVCCVALWVLWPKTLPVRFCSGVACLLIAGSIVSYAVAYTSTQVIMLDVGQGDAVLLRSHGQTMLVDTGNHDAQLYAGLSRYGVTCLDAVLISHADDDHCGSLAALKGVVQCRKVIVASGMDTVGLAKTNELIETASAYVGQEDIVEVSEGNRFSVGAFDCTVLSPDELTDEGGNQDSICFLAQADCDGDGLSDWSCLFTGDAESETLEKLEKSGRVGEVDLWKVSHHGAKAALTDELVAELSPDVALIGVGQNNTYGHPTAETLSRLYNVGAQVFRTDEMGDVVCDLTAQRIKVTTLR